MGLLASSADFGYWQSPPSPSGAWNGGNAPAWAGSGASSGDASEGVDAALLVADVWAKSALQNRPQTSRGASAFI